MVACQRKFKLIAMYMSKRRWWKPILWFVTLYATATWMPFKIPLLWLSNNGTLLYSSATYVTMQYNVTKSQTHYNLALNLIENKRYYCDYCLLVAFLSSNQDMYSISLNASFMALGQTKNKYVSSSMSVLHFDYQICAHSFLKYFMMCVFPNH